MRRVLPVVVVVTVLSVFLVEVGTPPAAADTLFVDPGSAGCDDSIGSPYCTIQAAVDAASSLDTISLSAGTHVGSGAYVVDMSLTTQKSLTFQGAGMDQTIIDGVGTRPGFRLVDMTFVVHDLTVLNGFSGGSGGGLILQGDAVASLHNVKIENANAGAPGGGIYVSSGSSLTLQDSYIVGNESGVNGGGLFGTGDVSFSITDSFIMNNTAATDGGGIAIDSSIGTPELTIGGSVLSGNQATDRGGAIYASLQGGDMTIIDTEIVDNDAGAGGGGGVFLDSGHHSIERSLFAGNDALGHGGGLHYATAASSGNSIEILNSTFSGNTAVGDGGGAYTNQVVANSTFVGNSATVQGGGVARTVFAAFQVRNTIMADNTAPDSPDCYGAISLGYNLTPSGSCFSSFDATNLLVPDPGLGPLADNGGATRTHALTWESDARDAGNPAVPGSGGDACEPVDQLSVARGADQCDIGAVELAATGGISGTVVAAGSAAPISGIPVALYSEAGTPIDTTVTSGSGVYIFSSVLTPAGYLVGFAADSDPFVPQWWNAKSEMSVADSIGLKAATVAIGVNASLEGGIQPTVGLFDASQGQWHLRNSTGAVTSFYFGNPGDYPIMGDWNCNGIDTVGMYRQSNGLVYLRNTNTQGSHDIRFFFGNPGDIPIVGDFNNNGCDTVSIYRPSNQTFYIINALGANDGGLGAAQFSYVFGNPGDKPFVGDFNGNGQDTIGLHRESTGFVYFRNTHTQGNADAQFFFGNPNDRFITGDWNANGIDSPGIFRPGNTTFYFRFTNTQGNADDQFSWGSSGWLPVSGNFGFG